MRSDESHVADDGAGQELESAESQGDPSREHAEANNVSDVDQVFEEAMDMPDSEKSLERESSVDQRLVEAEKETLRVRAEMDNYRKRMQRDAEQQLKYANMPLIRDLLEVGDNLRRALEAADSSDPDTAALREGVAMVSRQMNDVLAKYGCQPVKALGEPFDPNVHEAISQMASDEYPAGVVMNEVTVGYVLHDRVARPSQVIVSTGSPE